jgi:hypothetical protein
MMPKILLTGAVLFAGLVVVQRVRKMLPPFELGMHNLPVFAQSSDLRPAPKIGACQVFPSDNIWNTPIDKLPKDTRTDAFTDAIGALKGVHPDFSSNLHIGIPFTEALAGTRAATLTSENPEESDPGRYPIPEDAPIEGGALSAADGDHHVLVVEPSRCILYELWASRHLKDGSWVVGSAMKMDLTSNALRRADWTSADAAGLPILPGLVRYEEVQSGEINHALRFTLLKIQGSYVWPARHKVYKDMSMNLPPMGTRFRLRADFDTSKYSKSNQVIMNGLKRYGMFLADVGGSMFLSGVPDKRWDDSDLRKLGDMKAEDFEAVDESQLQLLPDSGRVDPVAYKALTSK